MSGVDNITFGRQCNKGMIATPHNVELQLLLAKLIFGIRELVGSLWYCFEFGLCIVSIQGLGTCVVVEHHTIAVYSSVFVIANKVN